MAREQSMKKFEDLYAKPPPYSSRASPGNTAAIEGNAQVAGSPKVEDMNFQTSPLEIPTPAECIAHLKLLHAFAKLRHTIGNCDDLYGISIETHDAELAERLREKRWSVFVTRAVARFEKWWENLSGAWTWYAPIRTENFETAGDSLYAGELCILHHISKR